MDLQAVEKRIGYSFSDKKLLEKALTLSSADGDFNNQSLECFGDSIIGFIVVEKLYGEGLDEGEITEKKKSVVSDAALTPVSKRLKLDKNLIRGKGDIGNKKAVPSAYEAVAAAIYLDGGLGAVKRFVLSTLDFNAKAVDFVSLLQEEVQGMGQPAPHYEKYERGTPQSPKFLAKVKVLGKVFNGQDISFSGAKKKAAERALSFVKSVQNRKR